MNNKSKNFEKWWENKGYFIYKENSNDIVETNRASWDACKNEVLKILKEHPNINQKTSLDKAFKKIQKL